MLRLFFILSYSVVTLQGSSYYQHFTSEETGSRRLNSLPHVTHLMSGGARIQTQQANLLFEIWQSAVDIEEVQGGKSWL